MNPTPWESSGMTSPVDVDRLILARRQYVELHPTHNSILVNSSLATLTFNPPMPSQADGAAGGQL
ncbi:unnamed protein product [Protopolystoma xenopodis]|uniref:Uncharacterized protein n=1 Tax=Protopolystoma xenopodis TaxID=117903 RepID=A0A3S5B2A9_9PLAT|nr:unnamed protein product [Protopolystoma xenopodis]